MAEPPLDRPALCADLESRTGALLEAARRGDWAALEQGQRDREAVLQRLFAQPVPAADAPRVERCVRHLLDRDAELKALVCRGRDEAEQGLRQLARGRKAQRAYGAVGR